MTPTLARGARFSYMASTALLRLKCEKSHAVIRTASVLTRHDLKEALYCIVLYAAKANCLARDVDLTRRDCRPASFSSFRDQQRTLCAKSHHASNMLSNEQILEQAALDGSIDMYAKQHILPAGLY